MSLISGVMPGLGGSLTARDTVSAVKGTSGRDLVDKSKSNSYTSGSHSGSSGYFTSSGYAPGSMADQLYNFKKNPAGSTTNSGKDISYVYGDSGGSSYSSGGSGRSKKEEFDWLYADMAKHYDMSKETGYQEAMENTSYQRAVKDMKAAGLNPAVLFGNNAGDVAGTPGYIRSASHGGGGGGGGGRSYGSARSRKLLSSNAYAGIAGAGAVAGGIIGGLTSKSAFGVSAGASAGAAIATSVAKVINGIMNG